MAKWLAALTKWEKDQADLATCRKRHPKIV